MHAFRQPKAHDIDFAVPHDSEFITLEYASIALSVAGARYGCGAGPHGDLVRILAVAESSVTGKTATVIWFHLRAIVPGMIYRT